MVVSLAIQAAKRAMHATPLIRLLTLLHCMSQQFVNAMVPLANTLDYSNTLRSMSHGRAPVTMQFDHYAELPGHGE